MRLPFLNCTLRDYPWGSVTQWFGENAGLYQKWKLGIVAHNGIDLVAYKGCPLLAVEDGIILSVKEEDGGFGKYVKMLSEDREWTYGHCDQIFVKAGQIVKEGDTLATMGNTGFVVSQATAESWWGKAPDDMGVHLHLGVRILKKDPKGFKYPGSKDRFSVQNYNNGYKGAIDPRPFLSIPILQRLVEVLKALVKKQ